jgi:type IV secretion system protein VirB6
MKQDKYLNNINSHYAELNPSDILGSFFSASMGFLRMGVGVIFFTMLFLPYLSFADNKCSPYNNSNIDINYLSNSTVYGYVLSSLSIKDYCSAVDDQINLCIKQNNGTCVDHIFNKDSNGVLISSLPSDKFKNPAFSSLAIKVKNLDQSNTLCLIMDTIDGELPLICRDVVAPDPTNQNTKTDTCSVPPSCTLEVMSPHSQLAFNFSGRMMECVSNSLDHIFFNQELCPGLDEVSSFSNVVNHLKQAISALLLMYAIAYGIRILLNPHRFQLEDAVIFVVKMLMVMYFTIGFQFTSIFANNATQKVQNGMVDVVLPALISLSSDLSQIVFNSAKTSSKADSKDIVGLCEFDATKYQAGYSYYALFDTIDCRLGYFLGYGQLSETESGKPKSQDFRIIKLIGGMLMQSPIFALFNIIFLYLLISTLLVRFVGTYIVYFICLYVMVLISPIFIPMVLFKQTKQMFDSWMKITLSFALQPAIIAAFMTIMFAIYDEALYGNCTFTRKYYPTGSIPAGSIATFTVNPSSGDGCTNTYGYKMLKGFEGDNWGKKWGMLFSYDVWDPGSDYLEAVMKALIISYIIYKFAMNAVQLAAALTGGVAFELKNSSEPKKNGADQSKKGADDQSKSGDSKAQDKANTPSVPKAKDVSSAKT